MQSFSKKIDSHSDRILFLTFYYYPDLCAGSFRNTPLVKTLKSHLSDNYIIDVITTSPNRYHCYKKNAPRFENKLGVNITRIPLPNHKSGLIDQIFAFSVYFFWTLKISRKNNYKIIYASSSRLMTAFLGAIISKTRSVPLYLDIRDIFVDTINAVFSFSVRKLITPLFSLIEKFIFSTAKRINLVSGGFKGYFNSNYPDKAYRFFTNGIDAEILNYNFENENRNNSKKILLYAGNIGKGQGLELIIPGLSNKITEDWDIVIIGDGGTSHLLEKEVKKINRNNVTFLPPMPRSKLLEYYKKSTCLFLHLNTHSAFDKVLPSKILEYGATGKPMIAGVGGYSKKFIYDELVNAIVFKQGDVDDALNALNRVSLASSDRIRFSEKYKRENIDNRMSEDILQFISMHKTRESK